MPVNVGIVNFWLTGPLYLQDGGGEGAKELEALHSERMKVVQLDVCSDEQVDRAVQVIQDSLADSERGKQLSGSVHYLRAPRGMPACVFMYLALPPHLRHSIRAVGGGEQRRRVDVRRGGVHLHGHLQAGVRGQPVGHHPGHQSCSSFNPQG